ncbi:MAG TPA: LamG-like jellyroll fold domain-containing protein [Dissulfurispiraceae bacterium]|nr:LamG-like jellyroll fold domain-containing protein [Dissulfurispiraceae bacterium]
MKRITSLLLIIVALCGFGAIVSKAAELQPIAFPFIGRWQPASDPVLIDDYGLQDIQNMRRSGKQFKGISGHTIINATSISAAPYFINGFHFRKDQPSESHVLVVAADTATPTASYLYRNTTAIPGAGDFSPFILHTDASDGIGAGRFSVAPQGNMVYANGAETLIWGGNEIEATAVVTSTAALTGTSSSLTNPQDYSDQLRNTRRTAGHTAVFGTVIDSYTKYLLHSDGTDASTIIVDAISTGRVITSAGSAQLDTAQEKFGTASSMYASATTDSISAADNADWDLGAGDFTVDAWVRGSSFATGSGTAVVIHPYMTSAATPYPFVVQQNQYPWEAFDGNVNTVGIVSVYGQYGLDLGAGRAAVATKYTIQAGTTAQGNQPKSWTFSGSNGGSWTTLHTQTNITSWTSQEVKTYTFANSTAYRYYWLYPTASNGTYVSVAEIQIYAAPYSNGTILSQSTTGNLGWGFYASGNALTFSYSTNGTDALSKSVTWFPVASTWNHLAVSRSSADLRFFVNGTQQGATQSLTGITFNNSTTTLVSGAGFNGWIDELRLSKGIARWTSSFAVATEPYGTGSPYWLVGFTRPIQGVKLYVVNPNTTTSTLAVSEWNGVSWTALSPTDNTSVGGISLAQTGTVTWPSTVGTSSQKYISGLPIYWYQFYLSAGAATVYYVTVDAPIQSVKNIWDGRYSYVANCLKWNAVNYIDYTDAVNDETTLTYLDVSSLSTTHNFVAGFSEPMQGVLLRMVAGKENTASATTMTVSAWDGSVWAALSGVFDDTKTSTTSLSQTGVVSWQSPGAGLEYERAIGNSAPIYYYQFKFAAALSANTQIAEIRGIAAPAPVGAYKFSETFQNRLFLFNEAAGEKNKAIYSVENAPDVFNGPGSGSLYFGDNTEIMAAASVYNVFGNSPYDQMIVGKKSEIYRLAGDSPETWNSKRISGNIGVVAPLSMVACEVAGGEDDTRSNVVIWQGDKGFYMTDGALVVPISDDIKCYFDPNDSRYIPTARRSKTVAWYDPLLRAYKALISSGTGQTHHNIELEYSLLTKEWTKIYRANSGGADPLQSGFQVIDTNGIGYTYGGNKSGFLYRLENGDTFAGTNITQYLHTKDLILDTVSPLFRKSTVKYLRTAHKKKAAAIGGGTISVAHYGDQTLTVDNVSNQNVPDPFSMSTAPYNTQSCALGPALYHSFKFTTSDTTAAGGMELIGLGFFAEPHTALR